MTTPISDPHGLAAQERINLRCPACGNRAVLCLTHETERGSWCCGDCTAHQGEHDWNRAAADRAEAAS